MSERKRGTVKDKAEKQQHIDDNGVAVSPLAAWPGRIVFPVPPTGRDYLSFSQAARKKEGESLNDFMALVPHWRGATAIARLELEGVDSTAFEDAPLEVIRWVVNTAEEYIRRFFLHEL